MLHTNTNFDCRLLVQASKIILNWFVLATFDKIKFGRITELHNKIILFLELVVEKISFNENIISFMIDVWWKKRFGTEKTFYPGNLQITIQVHLYFTLVLYCSVKYFPPTNVIVLNESRGFKFNHKIAD